MHVFETDPQTLGAVLRAARTQIAQNGFVWMSWPKKTSRVPTDITVDVIHDIALPFGPVDVKVCAVDTIWSGLKLMIREELRTQ